MLRRHGLAAFPRMFAVCLGLAWFPLASRAHGQVRIRPHVYDDFVLASATPRDQAQVEALWRLAEHVLAPHDPALVPHRLAVSRGTLEGLRRAGIDVAVEAASVQQMVDESYARNDQTAAADPAPSWFSRVQQLDAIEAYLDDLVGRAVGRAKVITIGRSIEGRDLRALLVSSRPDDNTRASIIVTGAQHAREWLSPMVVMGIAEGLVAGYEGDAQVKQVVDNLNVYIVPVMNPDGYVRTFSGNRLQRKNMRAGCNVDINRNFATGFGQKVSNNCNTETTSGPAAFSEPESQALRALAQKASRLRLYVDYHSNGNQVMVPYAYTRDEPPGYAKNRAWGTMLAAEARLPAQPAYALAQGEGGGSLDWFRETYTESLVVELPGRGFDPPANGIAANVELQWKGWLAVAAIVATENPGDGTGDGGAPAGDGGAAAPGGQAGATGSVDRDGGGLGGGGSVGAGAGGTAAMTGTGGSAMAGTGDMGSPAVNTGTGGAPAIGSDDGPPNGGCGCRMAGAAPGTAPPFVSLSALVLAVGLLRRVPQRPRRRSECRSRQVPLGQEPYA
jgi:hypothetical protein